MILAKVVLDSISATRLTTVVLEYPRFIHSQFMTHRVFSRNSASSRAVPTAKLIERVRTSPVMPVAWLKNQPGMVGGETLEKPVQANLEALWLRSARFAADTAEEMLKEGLHKQTVNRILEPYLPIKVLCTATEWENFLDLRLVDDAQPEMQELAKCIAVALLKSEPVERTEHLPYTEDLDPGLPLGYRANISAARCARISYENMGIIKAPEADVELAGLLHEKGHMSPFEHQAQALQSAQKICYNLKGWKSYRAILEDGEVLTSKRKPVKQEDSGWEE